MVLIYGYVVSVGFAIGDDLRKFLIGEYTRERAAEILTDRNFIKRWNENHTSELVKLSFEIEEGEQ